MRTGVIPPAVRWAPALAVLAALALALPVRAAAEEPPSCPCSIWGSGVTGPQDADAQAVELGTRFRSEVDGFVTGLRFYKTSGNTGTHVGRLWTAAGAQLAQAAFSGESAGGWQQVSFAEPVPIEAGATYIAAYHAPNGHY